jgi:hypothetical protein
MLHCGGAFPYRCCSAQTTTVHVTFLSNIATAVMVAETVDRARLARDEAYRLAIVARLRGKRIPPLAPTGNSMGFRRAA